MNILYKIERNSERSKYFVIRKYLHYDQPKHYGIEDLSLGIVTKLLSYEEVQTSCAKLSESHRVEAEKALAISSR